MTEDATTSAAVIEANRCASITQTPTVRSPSCEKKNNAGASERLVPPRVHEVNGPDNEMMHAKMNHFTNQAQGSEGASQAEGATAGATMQLAQQQHASGESPDDSGNVPTARLPTSRASPRQVANSSMRPDKATSTEQVFYL